MTLRSLDVQVYQACEEISEGLIFFAVLFGPWAFGTTQSWSIWTMNVTGYVLGILLGVKLFIRRSKGYVPQRWCASNSLLAQGSDRALVTVTGLTTTLAVLAAALIAYCLTSAANARATFREQTLSFDYHDCLRWLPHSLDSIASWNVFWTYLALACAFWAVWDWLQGKTMPEQRRPSENSDLAITAPLLPFPGRLRRLLWVLAVNGMFLGIEAIIQRLSGSSRLLFIVEPRIHKVAEAQFGSYAYRANAAQYFNLLWPVCVAFWWSLNRTSGRKHKGRHLLLVAAIVMAACPIVSTSRGGAMIALGILISVFVLLTVSNFFLDSPRNDNQPWRRPRVAALSVFVAAVLGLGFGFGWKALKPRMMQITEGFEGRAEMYAAARPMARDYPLFGTGPGTFETVSQLYPRPDIYWPAQLHNDWLETRITFGCVGSGLIAFALLTVLARWFVPGGVHGGRRFMLLLWLALGGCLVHARFDFPFQVHSVLFLFVVLCAIAFSLTRNA